MGNSQGPVLPLDAYARLEAVAEQLLLAVRTLREAGLRTNPVAAAALTTGAPTSSDCRGTLNLADVANAFLVAKARAGRSDAYLALMHKHVAAFVRGREGRLAAEISAAEIEAWLYGNTWKAKTRHGHLQTLRTLYRFAVNRALVAANPALAVDLPRLDVDEKGIHSPDQVATTLARCPDPSTLRFLVVRYFAGLRGTEAARLDENEIRLDAGLIVVAAHKAKTRRRRLVAIQPNLAAWLKATHRQGGRLPLTQLNDRQAAAVAAAGVPWPRNVTRHCFCSYHLAAFGNAAQTAMEAGHTEQQLFQHYRELTTLAGEVISRRLAREFWKINP